MPFFTSKLSRALSTCLSPGFAFFILNVDPGVTCPGDLVDSVAGAALAGCSKVVATYLAKITETDILRISPHVLDDLCEAAHNL
jgi:hypothetical protein